MNSEINTMDTGLTTLNNEVSALRGKIMAKEERINNLHMKHLYLESLASQRKKPTLKKVARPSTQGQF